MMKGTERVWTCLLALAVVISLCSAPLMAQSNRGIITGTVTDQSGAVVVGATITATHTATNVVTKTESVAGGKYAIPSLPVGIYTITAEQKSFKKFVQTGITVETGQTHRVDISLTLGQVSETVNVTADAAQIQADTSDRGTNVSGKEVLELPIVGVGEQRNPGYFMTLSPGVTGRGVSYSGSPRMLNTTVNGSQSASNEFVLDGALIGQGTEWAGDFRNLPFPVDAVGEFKVITLLPSAEYGRTGQGITTFNLRSGTNEIHGSVYEYFRNSALDARGFFAPKAAKNNQNEYGVTAGGPIRKDKTFFYGWYQGFRLRKGANNRTDTVPTAAMRGGDFSNLLTGQLMNCGSGGNQACVDALGRPVYGGELYDPATTRTVAAGAVDPGTGLVNTSGASAILRNGFGFNSVTGLPVAGQANVIPSNRIDPVSAKIFSYFPNPNHSPLPNGYGFQQNWLAVSSQSPNTYSWGVKIDQVFGPNNKIYGEFIQQQVSNNITATFPDPIGEGSIGTTGYDVARINWDYIIRPNLINHATAGYNRWNGQSISSAGLGWPATLGWGGVQQTGSGTVFPGLNIGGLGNTYGNGGQGYDVSNSYTFDDGLTWIKGRHTFKGGFQYIKMQQNDHSFGLQSGYLNFGCGATSLPGPWYGGNVGCSAGGVGTGFGAASFLLGMGETGRATVNPAGNADRMGQYGMYFQDDFKFSSKLTFNLGLRYDLFLPTVDAHNNKSWMDPTVANPELGGRLGAIYYATPDRRSAASTWTKAIGPRFGFAYSVNEKTVIRGGYGILYTTGGSNRSSRGCCYQTGYNADNIIPADSSTGWIGLNPVFTMSGGWPSNKFAMPPFINPSAGIGGAPEMIAAGDGRPPQIQNASISVQRQLPGQILLDVAYVWTKGTALVSRLGTTNYMPTQYLSLGDALNKQISDPATQALPIVQAMPIDPVTGHHSPFPGFEALGTAGKLPTILAQALRPFPQYTSLPNFQMRDLMEGLGQSNYNALQIQARKRLSYGLSFLVSYTWSKTLTNAESIFNEFSGFTQDPYNQGAEKALSINDYPSNLVISYQYELPFGPGKKWANQGGALGKVVGGWSVAGIQQYQSGPPLQIFSGVSVFQNYIGANGFLNRPNVVPGQQRYSSAWLNGTWDPNGDATTGARLNYNAWAYPDPYKIGNGARSYGDIRMPAYYNEEISIIKQTNITERVNVQFRVDFLNAFNRVVFGPDQGGDQYDAVLVSNALAWGPGGFGHITSQGNYPREIQFGLKINY
ncbi:MAG: TonB-dependent receptor [Terriglobia bacterium]